MELKKLKGKIILFSMLLIVSCKDESFVQQKTGLEVKTLCTDDIERLIIIEKNQINESQIIEFKRNINNYSLNNYNNGKVINDSIFLMNIVEKNIKKLYKCQNVNEIILTEFIQDITSTNSKYYNSSFIKVGEKTYDIDNLEMVICIPNKKEIYYFYNRGY